MGKGVIETTLTKSAGILADDEYELLDLLLTESGRPVTWLAVVDSEQDRRERKIPCARPNR